MLSTCLLINILKLKDDWNIPFYDNLAGRTGLSRCNHNYGGMDINYYFKTKNGKDVANPISSYIHVLYLTTLAIH